MAARLIAEGFPCVVYDINRQAAAGVLQAGAAWADSPQGIAEQAEIILASLPGPAEAEKAFLGPQGVVHGVRRGAILVDLTTNSASLVRQTHDALVEVGAAMLDAPVSGGVEAAKNGELTLLIGGESDALERVRPVLQKLAKTIVHVGGIGAASVCKALHNCAVFCANWATIECLTAGVKAGIDPAVIVDVFQKSGLGRNLDLQVAMPATLFRGNFQPRFAMKTACKDMRLATQLADEVGVPMKMAAMCEAEMAEAIRRGWAEKDNTIFLTLQEERAGVQVRLEDKALD